jgi:biotin transport system substrate-specific component
MEKTEELEELKKPLFTLKELTTMAVFAALLCVSAYISIPLALPGNPHLTVLNFMVLLIALLFPIQQSFSIILVWLLLGAFGLPVYIAGAAGFGYLAGPWGGYTFSFLVVALVLPLVRGKKYNRILYTVVAIVGALLIDLIGTLWLKIQNGYDVKTAFAIGFLAFLPLDMVKAVAVAQIVPFFKKLMRNS